MKKVSVTYKAPPADAKVVEMFGYTFHDGKAEEVEITETELTKLQGNPHFQCGQASDVKDDPKKPSAAPVNPNDPPEPKEPQPELDESAKHKR